MVYWPKEEALLMKDSENAPDGVNSMAMPQLSTRLYHMSQNIFFFGVPPQLFCVKESDADRDQPSDCQIIPNTSVWTRCHNTSKRCKVSTARTDRKPTDCTSALTYVCKDSLGMARWTPFPTISKVTHILKRELRRNRCTLPRRGWFGVRFWAV